MEKENIITNVEETPISTNKGNADDIQTCILYDKNQLACYSSVFATAVCTISGIVSCIMQDPIAPFCFLGAFGLGTFSGYSFLEMNKYKEDYRKIHSENEQKVKIK